MTHAELHERASALFLELRELERDARPAALDAAVGDDADLRREVESLLDYDLGDEPPRQTRTVETGLPTRIGPYEIIERIGRGGSGEVLLAEQHEPIRRRVAIKVVPQAAVSLELAARFDVERRALECTDHPNIARVVDAGRTPDGLPYLVMDYIEGAPITTYCDEKGIGLLERIGLVLQVADAMQHAHQRGVIHRDLKPANILVTEQDGAPTPIVLDFGIAKPVGGAIAEESPMTSGLPVGTPAYMAPEQTGIGEIDSRADVYALGAVLYELAAGQPPIETADDPLAALARIREDVPAPASRVRLASPRFVDDPITLWRLADLDCILGKALEKAPDRRYESVGALAADLRRLLGCEPIEARPPTIGYRTSRFVRRNRVLVGATALVAAALIVGLVGLAIGLVTAERQRLEALDQYAAQQAINEFLTDDLLAAASPDIAGTDVTALDLLRRASAHVDDRFADRPLIAAAVHHVVGDVFGQLGEYDDADRHLSKALALRLEHDGPDAPATLRSEIASASLLVLRQRYDDGAAALDALIARARDVLGPDDADLYTALNDLGVALDSLGRFDEATAVLKESLAGRNRLLGGHDRLVLTTTANLAGVYANAGDGERSIEMMKQALEIAEGLPDEPRFTLIGLNNNIGATYQDMELDDDAAPYLRTAAALAREHLGDDHPATITIRGNLAGLEAELGNPEAALPIFAELIEQRMALHGPDAQDTLTSRYAYWNAMRMARRFDEAADGYTVLLADLERTHGEAHWLTAQTGAALARALLDGGRPDEALPHARKAAGRLESIYGPDHIRTRSALSIVEQIEGEG